MRIGNYIFNPRYIRYVRLIRMKNDTIIRIHSFDIMQTDEIQFSFKEFKEAEKVFKFIQRKMSGES